MNDNMMINLLGPYIFAPEVLKERNEVTKYYNFFYGKADSDYTLLTEINKGQSWIVRTGIDYVPSQDIRNHVKKLLKKQARFMFGVSPDLLFKPYKKEDTLNVEELRKFIDNILEDNEFWNDTFKAFLDCTIGKRVLIRVEANPNEPIGIYYHTMDEFTFEVDKSNFKNLTQVIIAYMDKESSMKDIKEQVWRRWKYYFENEKCMLQQGSYDGYGAIIDEDILDTGLDEIPCKVIFNGGLTGDITGSSDLVDLMDMQDAYNHVSSDFRDALRFKMFEQPVFIDSDPDSTENIKIAPNAIIDLKTDPTVESGKADAKMLSSTFNFVDGTKIYLEDIKADMYELMDQPRPGDIKNVPSAKAMKFAFYDLISRCKEKWQEWESALKWLVRISIKCTIRFKLYPDEWDSSWNNLNYKLVIKHNFPLPEDTEELKKTAILEVNANVRSVKGYLRDISEEEDVGSAFEEILKGIEDIRNAELDQFTKAEADELGNLDQNVGD